MRELGKVAGMGGLSIIVAVLGFAFVIFIHELGHFLFAKWAGVKVERFSIGMGPIVWSRQIGETEYALSLLPLGGYVKMLGQEELPGQVTDSEDSRSYNNKHPAWRAAILFAGVLFNIVSSYIILLGLAWYGMPVITPQVGTVQSTFMGSDGTEQTTPAWESNLHVGDRILSVDGKKVRSFMDIIMYTTDAGTEAVTLEVMRGGKMLDPVRVQSKYNPVAGRHTLGIGMSYGLRIADVAALGQLDVDAHKQLAVDDRIVGIRNSTEAFDATHIVGQQVYDRLKVYSGSEVTLIVERAGVQRDETIRYYEGNLLQGSIGAMVHLDAILAGKPAEKAGLQAGDYVRRVNGIAVFNSAHFQGLVREAAMQQQDIILDVYRADADGVYAAHRHTMQCTVDAHTGKSMIGVVMSSTVVGPILYDRPISSATTAATPLTAAGLIRGDCIIAYEVPLQADGTQQRLQDISTAHVLRVRGGTLGHLPLDETLYRQWRKITHPGFFGKVFGVKPSASDWSRLMSARVVHVPTAAEPYLMVQQYAHRRLAGADGDAQGEVQQIDVSAFSEEQRHSLYALQHGDWIINSNVYTPGHNNAQLVYVRGSTQETPERVLVHLGNPGTRIALMTEEHPYKLASWTEAFSVANATCGQVIGGTLNLIPRFFKSPENGGVEASKSIGGPISIFTVMKKQTEYFGFASFLKLLAVIGINLFLINLLPIPIVDGGQLVILGIEVIIRRPVPEAIINVAMWIGLLLIMSLMVFALGVDIERNFLQ